MKRKLHTPEGVRDIYNIECGKKLTLESRLHKVFHLYGYHDIQTPMFEYFDVFSREIGTIPSKDLYKFFDKDGNTLVLRPDITPSIARVAATLFQNEELPIKLCYTGNTFINRDKYQGRLRENTQMGCEHFGDDSIEADAEMIAMVVEAMLTIGLKDFQLILGNVEYLDSMIMDAGLNDEQEERVRTLIKNRNFYGVGDYLEKIEVDKKIQNSFVGLNSLFGGVDVLMKAHENASNERAERAVERLMDIYQILKLYGVEKFISFDLSMSGFYGYYTGIIMRGYTYGIGNAIIKGGRYDKLIGKFGKDSAAIGFVIVIDELMNALTRQKARSTYKRNNTIVLYDKTKTKEAIMLSKDFRRKKNQTEMMQFDPSKTLTDYIDYGNRYYASNLVYVQNSGEILMMNLESGEQKIVRTKG
ncbi:MAG: ATP phosphoribosyltransferase regulatory subunit [Dorea sp.]|nr:ATP phosphoribosyltransferase regulatory subunit [Dorea sp.]